MYQVVVFVLNAKTLLAKTLANKTWHIPRRATSTMVLICMRAEIVLGYHRQCLNCTCGRPSPPNNSCGGGLIIEGRMARDLNVDWSFTSYGNIRKSSMSQQPGEECR